LKLNDVVVDINGKRVRTPSDMAKQLKNFKTGDAVAVGFLRQGTRRQVTMTLNGKHAV
jgi:S1-C subfamily serine protease